MGERELGGRQWIVGTVIDHRIDPAALTIRNWCERTSLPPSSGADVIRDMGRKAVLLQWYAVRSVLVVRSVALP